MERQKHVTSKKSKNCMLLDTEYNPEFQQNQPQATAVA